MAKRILCECGQHLKEPTATQCLACRRIAWSKCRLHRANWCACGKPMTVGAKQCLACRRQQDAQTARPPLVVELARIFNTQLARIERRCDAAILRVKMARSNDKSPYVGDRLAHYDVETRGAAGHAHGPRRSGAL